MDPKSRLQDVQSVLEKRGMRDVKFLFNVKAQSEMPSAVKNDVADIMEKYLAGHKTSMFDFSEEVLPNLN